MRESDRGIGVRCKIIEQVFCFNHCVNRPFCLFACYHAQCHEHDKVNSMSIVQDAVYYLLDRFDIFITEGGQCVRGEGTLGFAPALFRQFRHGSIGTIFLPRRGCMLVFLELLDDVARHRNVECPRNIVPVEANTSV
jgi:hypothetical protein